MSKGLFAAAAAAVLAMAGAPSRAAAPEPVPPSVNQELDALGAWATQITHALSPANAAISTLGPAMKGIVPNSADGAQMRAAAPRLRAVIQQARSAVLQSRNELAAIPSFQSRLDHRPPIDPNRLLVDSRAQIEQLLQYLDACDLVATALAQGDARSLQQIAPKLMRSGFLVIRGQALLFRNRQAAIPQSQSAFQATGVTVQLYEAMSAAGDAWYQARVERQADRAVAWQHMQFIGIAADTEGLIAAGRSNLARERAELASERLASAADPEAQRLLARVERMLAQEERMFAVGGELAAWARQHADIGPDALGRQNQPELLLQLSAIEQEMVAISAASAAVLAGSGG